MRYIIAIIIAAFLLSCSPQQKLRRLLKKYPELVKIDSIKYTDTTIIPKYELDTIMFVSEYTDTIWVDGVKTAVAAETLYIDNPKVRIHYQRIRDTVRLNVECKTDTIYKDRVVATHVEYDTSKNTKWYTPFIWAFAALFAIIFFIFIFKVMF